MEKSDDVPYLCVWLVAAVLLVWKTWKRAGAGLILSYCFQLFMLYWLGGLIHAFPWSDLPKDEFVLLGLQESTYAIVAFAAGSLVAGSLVAAKNKDSRLPQSPDHRLPRLYILMGIVSYFVLAPTLGRLSGFNAVGAVGSQFVLIGISLNCWRAWSTGGAKPLLRSLAPSLLIPVVTLFVQGFMSYGIIALSTIIIFAAQFFRPRWVLLVGGLVIGYMGLTVYANYMRDRDELRASIWGGESYSDRVSKTRQSIEQSVWFDWRNPDHLSLIDIRLNQTPLIGAAVVNLSNTGNYAHGSTLVEAVANMIPRIIWPSKPISAGSGDMVSRFTGMDFAQGTSIGVGPVLELYGNYGEIGIWIGFAILGCLLTTMDAMAGQHLLDGNWISFGKWFLVGIPFLNVSGSFVECTAGAMASLALAFAAGRILRSYDSHKNTTVGAIAGH